jgi:putative endonuclease
MLNIYELMDRVRHRIRSRRWAAHQAVGRWGEDVAYRYLRRSGYTVVARNYRTKSGAGEVDLIAIKGEDIAFVEVKTRTSDEFGPPDRAIDETKRLAMLRSAREFCSRTGSDFERVRFDVLGVLTTPVSVTHFKNVFGRHRC